MTPRSSTALRVTRGRGLRSPRVIGKLAVLHVNLAAGTDLQAGTHSNQSSRIYSLNHVGRTETPLRPPGAATGRTAVRRAAAFSLARLSKRLAENRETKSSGLK
jgi:hypothetical protein